MDAHASPAARLKRQASVAAVQVRFRPQQTRQPWNGRRPGS